MNESSFQGVQPVQSFSKYDMFWQNYMSNGFWEFSQNYNEKLNYYSGISSQYTDTLQIQQTFFNGGMTNTINNSTIYTNTNITQQKTQYFNSNILINNSEASQYNQQQQKKERYVLQNNEIYIHGIDGKQFPNIKAELQYYNEKLRLYLVAAGQISETKINELISLKSRFFLLVFYIRGLLKLRDSLVFKLTFFTLYAKQSQWIQFCNEKQAQQIQDNIEIDIVHKNKLLKKIVKKILSIENQEFSQNQSEIGKENSTFRSDIQDNKIVDELIFRYIIQEELKPNDQDDIFIHLKQLFLQAKKIGSHTFKGQQSYMYLSLSLNIALIIVYELYPKYEFQVNSLFVNQQMSNFPKLLEFKHVNMWAKVQGRNELIERMKEIFQIAKINILQKGVIHNNNSNGLNLNQQKSQEKAKLKSENYRNSLEKTQTPKVSMSTQADSDFNCIGENVSNSSLNLNQLDFRINQGNQQHKSNYQLQQQLQQQHLQQQNQHKNKMHQNNYSPSSSGEKLESKNLQKSKNSNSNSAKKNSQKNLQIKIDSNSIIKSNTSSLSPKKTRNSQIQQQQQQKEQQVFVQLQQSSLKSNKSTKSAKNKQKSIDQQLHEQYQDQKQKKQSQQETTKQLHTKMKVIAKNKHVTPEYLLQKAQNNMFID
ncbi:hypothetical protein PPERSA_03168 [Pseudocohnilembus persalinus]|uniref:Uncharacterized protein n=1 Tax=Pseudocohnilembus persalinus TaxID=266149 RepID=A0A0V0QDZ6_PSEPJ|nr:hypothetical protein PPERSA_03168 [Pseudocohnilembus persalinus]|eukprot:KRX00435.1 hypothetical protein PPERSA_03168 [Pseudocohnilembus persalinus]